MVCASSFHSPPGRGPSANLPDSSACSKTTWVDTPSSTADPAVVAIATLLGAIAYAPHLKNFRPRTWATAVALAAALVVFAVMLVRSFRYADRRLGPEFDRVERESPR